MKVFYKTRFNIKTTDVSHDIVSEVIEHIRTWLEDKYGLQLVDSVIKNWDLFVSGGIFNNPNISEKICAESINYDNTAWACRIVENPPVNPQYIPRQWITEIGCRLIAPTEVDLSYSVCYEDLPEHSGSRLSQPAPNVPKVAQKLITSKKWVCCIDGVPISVKDTLFKKYKGSLFGLNECRDLIVDNETAVLPPDEIQIVRKDDHKMWDMKELSEQDITYLCKQMPPKEIRTYFQKNPKDFVQIKPGFRPNAISDEDAINLMIRYQNKPFIRAFTEKIIKLWLQEIENFRKDLEQQGESSEKALIRTLSQSVFSDNIELYFTLCDKECSDEYIGLMKSAVSVIKTTGATAPENSSDSVDTTSKIETLEQQVKQLQNALETELSAHRADNQILAEATAKNAVLQQNLAVAEARVNAVATKTEQMQEELERLRKLAKYSDVDVPESSSSEFEYTSICQVYSDYYTGQTWLTRLADISDGTISRFIRMDDVPKYFGNRDRLFWRDGPRDDGYIGVWHWNAVPNASDTSTDYVTTSFNKHGKVIEVIELPDCRTYEDIVKVLSENGISCFPGHKYFFALNKVNGSIPGLLCNEDDLDFANGIAKLSSTTCVLPQFIIASSDIITLADKNYYRFTTLGTPQDIYHVKTPFGVVKDVIISRATSAVLRQQGITKKEAQHCQSFLRELPVETLTQEIADAYGCPEVEAKEYLSSFLASAEAYLDESDMDVGTLTAAISRNPEIVQKCKHLLSAEWQAENEEAIKTAQEKFEEIMKATSEKSDQANDIENTIAELRAQVADIEAQITSKLQLASDVETKVADRIAAARTSVADFICEMAFTSNHVTKAPVSEKAETLPIAVRHNIICNHNGTIDDPDSFEEELACNLNSLGYNASTANEMSQAIVYCISRQLPILCGSNGAAIADAISALFHTKGAYEVTLPIASDKWHDICATLGNECMEDNAVILLNGVFDGYSPNAYNTVLQHTSSWKNNSILIFSINGILPEAIPTAIWDNAWFIDGDVGLTQFPHGTLNGYEVHCSFVDVFEEAALKAERKKLKSFSGNISNRAALNYSGFMVATGCELKDSNQFMMQFLIQGRAQGKTDEIAAAFESAGIELATIKALAKYL